jgi:hypothetical protein
MNLCVFPMDVLLNILTEAQSFLTKELGMNFLTGLVSSQSLALWPHVQVTEVSMGAHEFHANIFCESVLQV